MIKKALILALTATALAAAELKPVNLTKPRFEGDGNYEKRFVIKAFIEKSPNFIFSKFNKKINIKETDELGFPLWKFSKCVNGKEHLAEYKEIIVDKRWVVEGRMVFSFHLDFCKPINSTEAWECWDAFYTLLPKGVDWHKEQEKIANEKF
tara:strand:- start:3180 stop:3632 length:453 start_codon:yes stop_codon:yes gene_type:complete